MLRPAPETFDTKGDAEDFLGDIETDLRRDEWTDPDAGKIAITTYCLQWIAERGLELRTIELYQGFVRNHIKPRIGDLMLSELTPAMVRRWRMDMLKDRVGATTVAKVYRFLRAVLNTAVDDDELIRRNPCRIKGAGQEHAPERPTVTVVEVFAIAHAIARRYRLLVLLAAFGQLRFGELIALRKTDLLLPPPRRPTAAEVAAGVDPDDLIDDGVPVLLVRRAVAQLGTGEQVLKGPKSEAGNRTVALPSLILPDIRAHLAMDGKGGFVDPEPHGRLFRGPKGATPRRQNFNSKVWKPARAAAGVNPELHLHDLRHAGATLTARTGATLRELMSRLGQSSTRAALIYQHAASERDVEIAVALDTLIRKGIAEAEGEATA
ncbi:tyrosine-type recombinase/integrase [Kutzneria sp. NPDC051319]|uniref:tyrosine-type recombinase/integrase n=1 Tax=Kutzneria sp. NPDC051319 TaxID=3155047 RepID=UPI0034266923